DDRAFGASPLALPARLPRALPRLRPPLRVDVLPVSLRPARCARIAPRQSLRSAEVVPPLEVPQPLLAQIRAGDHAMDRRSYPEPAAAAVRRQAERASPQARAGQSAAQRPHLAARADHQ